MAPPWLSHLTLAEHIAALTPVTPHQTWGKQCPHPQFADEGQRSRRKKNVQRQGGMPFLKVGPEPHGSNLKMLANRTSTPSTFPQLIVTSIIPQSQRWFPDTPPPSGPNSVGQKSCLWSRALKVGAVGQPRGMGWGGKWEGVQDGGTHVYPWLIHVNVWQKPLQYYKVISL